MKKNEYSYAHIWDEEGSSCLAIEHVMTSAGPVILGVLGDGTNVETVKRIVGWFYEDALPIICEHGLGKRVRNTFMQRDDFRDEKLRVVVLHRGRYFVYPEDGSVRRLPKKTGVPRGYLLASEDFIREISGEECGYILGEKHIGTVQSRLDELGRRAQVRNREGSYSAVYLSYGKE